MTAPTNRFLATAGPTGNRPEAYMMLDGVMVACTWDEYVAHMNAITSRDGTYVTKIVNGKRTLDWIGQSGSDGWLRERGITPPADRRAKQKADSIGHYVTDYGRAD